MCVVGWVMAVAALLGLLIGANMEVGVYTGLSGKIVNSQLLSQQANVLHLSGLLFAAGAILVGLGLVKNSIESAATAARDQSKRIEDALLRLTPPSLLETSPNESEGTPGQPDV